MKIEHEESGATYSIQIDPGSLDKALVLERPGKDLVVKAKEGYLTFSGTSAEFESLFVKLSHTASRLADVEREKDEAEALAFYQKAIKKYGTMEHFEHVMKCLAERKGNP